MLLAEIHGHRIPEAANSEDYLTSAVFGHLRYLPPSTFWQTLFESALAMPKAESKTLGEYLEQYGISANKFDSLEIHFWPRHAVHGIPDLILVFSGASVKPLVILIEAKLWSQKSGTGDFDQIARYLGLLDDPQEINPKLPPSFSSALIYLTEHDSLAELEDSVSVCTNPENARSRIFRLQWQDIVVAGRRTISEVTGFQKLLLNDVMRFLCGRNLEYFRGFHRVRLPDVHLQLATLFKPALFTKVPLPSDFPTRVLIEQNSPRLLTTMTLPVPFNIMKGSWL